MVLNSAYAFNAGVTASLDWKTMASAKDTFMDKVLEIVNNQTLPDLDFTNGAVKGNSFHIAQYKEGVQMFPNQNGDITLQISDLSASFGSESLFYKKWYFVANGSLQVDITQLSLSVRVGLKTQSLPNGDRVPKLEVVAATLDIPSNHLKVQMAGNTFFRVVDDIQYYFINEIRFAINEAVSLGIEYELPKVFDSMMVKEQGRQILYKNIGLDY